MADEQQTPAGNESTQKSIQPVKIYMRDVSFETPNSPAIFLKEWRPSLGLELGNQVAVTKDGHHEVVLTITATVKVDDETAYLAEVHQAGLFAITGVPENELDRAYRVFCNRFLFPYASAALSDLVTRGGFPQLLLSPVNWEQLYQQRQPAS
jgi:preprotein translocase subunit SecB